MADETKCIVKALLDKGYSVIVTEDHTSLRLRLHVVHPALKDLSSSEQIDFVRDEFRRNGMIPYEYAISCTDEYTSPVPFKKCAPSFLK